MPLASVERFPIFKITWELGKKSRWQKFWEKDEGEGAYKDDQDWYLPSGSALRNNPEIHEYKYILYSEENITLKNLK